MKNLKKLVLAFAFIYAPIAANAWGVLGHRIVGEMLIAIWAQMLVKALNKF